MRYGKASVISFLVCLVVSLCAYADQVIYVEVSQFDPALSEFGVAVLGNTWVETEDDGAINGTAFGGPGDNSHGGDGGKPALVIKVPVNVKAGEGTSDGKTWAAWARLYVPIALGNDVDFNSFFLRSSTDAEDWTPATGGSTALRWNDPGAMFPFKDDVDGVVLTDLGDQLPWWWQQHKAGNQSTIDPVMEMGANYIEIGPRDSHPIQLPADRRHLSQK